MKIFKLYYTHAESRRYVCVQKTAKQKERAYVSDTYGCISREPRPQG